jgi:hypothetical protein
MMALPKLRVRGRRKPMTVCIAAVCSMGHERGPIIVAAADRMITIGHIEYEPAQTKMVTLATQTVGLFAGDMRLHALVVPKVLKRVGEVSAEAGSVTVEQIAEFYADEFLIYRRSLAEREIIAPLKMTLDTFPRSIYPITRCRNSLIG